MAQEHVRVLARTEFGIPREPHIGSPCFTARWKVFAIFRRPIGNRQAREMALNQIGTATSDKNIHEKKYVNVEPFVRASPLAKLQSVKFEEKTELLILPD